MFVLAIDTATLASGVALLSEEQVLAEFVLQTARTHSQRLLPSIDFILQEAGIRPSQLDAVVVSAGPGSFTGLRIGMSTAKGFAHALGIPIIGVNTLDFWAENYPCFSGSVVPILDARKGEVYTATYRWVDGEMERVTAPRAMALSALIKELLPSSGPIAFVGDAVQPYRHQLVDGLGDRAVVSLPTDRMPRPSRLAYLGLKRLQKGAVDELFTLVPQYLRQSEAEVKLAQKIGKEAAL